MKMMEMYSFVLLGLLGCTLAVPTSSPIKRKFDNLIIGGDPVNIEDYPYQLSMQWKENHKCGASIISEKWALTAAHCLQHCLEAPCTLLSNSSIQSADSEYAIIHQIEVFTPHELYYRQSNDYDIGVIKIRDTFFPPGSIARPVTLPAPGGSPNVGDLANISGWGTTAAKWHERPAQLYAVQVPIIERSKCAKLYEKIGHKVTDRMLCAGFDEGGKDSCQGDSGGPLLVGDVQFGVVSWGKDCAEPGQPGVYADVGNLRSWITNQTKI